MAKRQSRVEKIDPDNLGLDAKKIKLLNKTLDLPDSVESPRQLVIRLDKAAIDTARKATDELLISRRINVDADNISVADIVAIAILDQDREISGTDAANKAGGFYKLWQEEARREGLMVGITMHTALSREPLPYLDDEDDDDETPDWLKDDIVLPEPNRDLNNRYEKRLKQLYDVLDDAGVLFSARFKSILDDDMADQLRAMGVGAGGTDPDGFHKAGTHNKVSANSGSEGENN